MIPVMNYVTYVITAKVRDEVISIEFIVHQQSLNDQSMAMHNSCNIHQYIVSDQHIDHNHCHD